MLKRAGLTVFLAVSMLAVTLQLPAAAQGDGTDPGGDDPFSVSDLFELLGTNAVGDVEGAGIGWALGALGLTGGSAPNLDALVDDLNEILGALTDIENELAALEAELEVLGCDALSADLKDERSLIDSLVNTYKGFVSDGAGDENFPPVEPPASRVNAWVAEVIDDVNGVERALEAINNTLLDAGSAQGVISACLQPGVIAPPAVGSIGGDSGYYDKVQNLTNLWYSYQAQGLLLLQEAYHWDAQQNSTATPDTTSDICTDPDPKDPNRSIIVDDCKQAIQTTNIVYEHLSAQLLLAGAPYSDDNVVLHTRRSDEYTLWVRSMEAFTKAAGSMNENSGEPCGLLTYDNVCGLTVGIAGNTRPIFQLNGANFEYANYSIWRPAPNSALTPLLSGRGSQTAAAFLNANGFENAGNKLLITADQFGGQVRAEGDSYGIGQVGCFVDTNFTFGMMCDNDQLQHYYTVIRNGCGRNVWWEFRQSEGITANSLYYGFRYITDTNPGGNCVNNGFTTSPGWRVEGAANNFKAPQLQWPMFDIGKLTCSAGRTNLNPGGVPTRCGADYDAWFDQIVARPPSCGGTDYGKCSTDSVAVTISNGREDISAASEPAFADTVIVTDEHGPKSITGDGYLTDEDGIRREFDLWIRRTNNWHHGKLTLDTDDGTIRLPLLFKESAVVGSSADYVEFHIDKHPSHRWSYDIDLIVGDFV